MTDQHDVPALIAELRRLEAAATPGEWRAGRMDTESFDAFGGGPYKAVYADDERGGVHPEFGDPLPYTVARGEGDECLPNAALIAAMRNALPMLLDIAERYQHVQCRLQQEAHVDIRPEWIRVGGVGPEEPPPEVDEAMRLYDAMMNMLDEDYLTTCQHEQRLAEYKAVAEKLLCDKAESADPAGLLRAADMVPAQALRDLDAHIRRRIGHEPWGIVREMLEILRALFPENAEATS